MKNFDDFSGNNVSFPNDSYFDWEKESFHNKSVTFSSKFGSYNQINEVESIHNDFEKKEINKINTEKNEEKIITNEIKKDEKKLENKNEDKNEEKEKEKSNTIDSSIIRYFKEFLKIIEEGFKFDDISLFNIIDFLIPSLERVFVSIFSKISNFPDTALEDFTIITEKLELLKEIKKLKAKEIQGRIDEDEMAILIARIILFMENKGNNKIRDEFKEETRENEKPKEIFQNMIEKFLKLCLEDQIKYLMRITKERESDIQEEIKPEKKEIKNLGKKRNNKQNDDDDDEEIRDKNPSVRTDNVLMRLKRNLIQNIFLNWINHEESDKNNKLIKLDPILFRKSYDFNRKKLKEIYSEKISIKVKNVNENHNINIIKEAEGIKKIKLNCTFEQAFKLFYYKNNQNEILEIIEKVQDNENIGSITDFLKGLKGKDEYLAENEEKEGSLFKEKLLKKLIKIEKKILADEK
jgi:hypothetical protein